MAERMTFMVEDARILFENFAGNPDRYNKLGGKRSFCVILERDVAEQMLADGWNVKLPDALDNDEDGYEKDAYINVAVSFSVRPPRIVMMTDTARTNLTESNVEVLDWADIEKVDVIANASHYDKDDGTRGIKAYLKSLYVTINQDALERKYDEGLPGDATEVEND